MASEAQVQAALLDYVQNTVRAVRQPPLEVSYPNADFAPPTRDPGDGSSQIAPYLSANVIFNGSALEGISFAEEVEHSGLLTLNVVWPAGQGSIKPLQLAGEVAAALRPGTRIYRDSVFVRVYAQPRVAPVQQESDRVTVPVITRWVATAPPN